MNNIIKLTDKHLAVKLPDDAIGVHLDDSAICWEFKCAWGDCLKLDENFRYIFLFVSSQATEEQAQMVCEFCTPDAEGQIMHWTEWKNYNGMGWLDTALESFHSLIKSKGITGNAAILEINN